MSIKRKDIKEIFPDATDEAVSKLIGLIHSEVDTVKDEKDELQKQLDKANADLKAANDAKEKAEKDFTDYKDGQKAKETKSAKESAVREYLKSKGIPEKSISLAMRSVTAEVDGVELDSNGKIKTTKVLDDLLTGDLSALVATTDTKGASTKNPPNGSSGGKMTKEDIMKISDTAERQKAMLDNHELFGF